MQVSNSVQKWQKQGRCAFNAIRLIIKSPPLGRECHKSLNVAWISYSVIRQKVANSNNLSDGVPYPTYLSLGDK